MSVLDCNMSFEDDTSINSQYQNQDNVQDAFQNGLQLYSCNTNSINNHKTPCCDITIYNNTKLPEVGMVEFFSEESLRVSISGDNSTESMLSLRHTGSYHGDNNTHLVWRVSTNVFFFLLSILSNILYCILCNLRYQHQAAILVH